MAEPKEVNAIFEIECKYEFVIFPSLANTHNFH